MKRTFVTKTAMKSVSGGRAFAADSSATQQPFNKVDTRSKRMTRINADGYRHHPAPMLPMGWCGTVPPTSSGPE